MHIIFLDICWYAVHIQGTTSTVLMCEKHWSGSRRKEGMPLQPTYWCKESFQRLLLLIWFVVVFAMRPLQFLSLEYTEPTCGTKIRWPWMTSVDTWCGQKFLHQMKVVLLQDLLFWIAYTWLTSEITKGIPATNFSRHWSTMDLALCCMGCCKIDKRSCRVCRQQPLSVTLFDNSSAHSKGQRINILCIHYMCTKSLKINGVQGCCVSLWP